MYFWNYIDRGALAQARLNSLEKYSFRLSSRFESALERLTEMEQSIAHTSKVLKNVRESIVDLKTRVKAIEDDPVPPPSPARIPPIVLPPRAASPPSTGRVKQVVIKPVEPVDSSSEDEEDDAPLVIAAYTST